MDIFRIGKKKYAGMLIFLEGAIPYVGWSVKKTSQQLGGKKTRQKKAPGVKKPKLTRSRKAKSNCSIVFHFVCGLCVSKVEGVQSKFTKY